MGKTKKGGGEGDDEPVKYRNLILQCMGTKKSIRRERLQTKVRPEALSNPGMDGVRRATLFDHETARAHSIGYGMFTIVSFSPPPTKHVASPPTLENPRPTLRVQRP